MSGIGPLFSTVPNDWSNHCATAGYPTPKYSPASRSWPMNVGYATNAAPRALQSPYDHAPAGLTPLAEKVFARLSQGPLGNGTPPSGQAITWAARGTCTVSAGLGSSPEVPVSVTLTE